MRKWERVFLLLCIAGSLFLAGGLLRRAVCAASESRQEIAGKGDTDGDGTQGASDAGGTAGFVIDNENIYEGMDGSYAEGYIPRIVSQGGQQEAVIVLPLLAKRQILQNRIAVSLRFGESEQLPFLYKNYEKAVTFGYHRAGKTVSGCYLVTFRLALKKERCNGSYPVTLSVAAQEKNGNEINQEFTVYVTITDGKEAGESGQQGASDGASVFTIENKGIYEGMEKSYSGGYIPRVASGRGSKAAEVVLPLLSKRKLSQNRITVTLQFGETENLPFVRKNYQKEVSYGYHTAKNKGKKVGCYLVDFRLALKQEYDNGNFPVVLLVEGEDQAGNGIKQEFTVYVTLTDGKRNQQGGRDSGKTKYAPKVMISSCRFSGGRVSCGKKQTATVTLRNTSKTDAVKNMLVTIKPGENVELLEAAGSSYVETLRAGGTCEISFVFRVNAAAAVGQYNIGVTMEYADSRGSSYSAEGTVNVSAGQQTKLELAPLNMPKEIQLGETVELQTQAMNLGRGKLYHVRAVVEADGLLPSGSAFIGDMEAGTSMTGSLELTAEGLSGDSLYGTVEGRVIFYYEDEMGKEMTQEQPFETAILSPLRENRGEAADNTGQWWVIMAVIVVFLVQAATIFFMRRSRPAVGGDGGQI